MFQNFFQTMSKIIFQPMFLFRKRSDVGFPYRFPAGPGGPFRSRLRRSLQPTVGLKPHRMRASAIPIVCLAGNGGGNVSPETYRFSELETMSKIFSSRCLNIFLAHLSFSKKIRCPFSIQILGRPAAGWPRPPSKFSRLAPGGARHISDTKNPIPIVYAYGTSSGRAPAETPFFYIPLQHTGI